MTHDPAWVEHNLSTAADVLVADLVRGRRGHVVWSGSAYTVVSLISRSAAGSAPVGVQDGVTWDGFAVEHPQVVGERLDHAGQE